MRMKALFNTKYFSIDHHSHMNSIIITKYFLHPFSLTTLLDICKGLQPFLAILIVCRPLLGITQNPLGLGDLEFGLNFILDVARVLVGCHFMSSRCYDFLRSSSIAPWRFGSP